MATTTLGSEGEQAIVRFLQQKGITILACNYKRRFGEIDIVAQDKNTLLFIEVKTRSKNYFDAAELITSAKQKRIVATAISYVLENNYAMMDCRFDVALLSCHDTKPSITYIPNAFQETP